MTEFEFAIFEETIRAKERVKTLKEAITKLTEYKSKLDPIDWIIVNQCIEYLEEIKEQK